jgi:hypothetical protein
LKGRLMSVHGITFDIDTPSRDGCWTWKGIGSFETHKKTNGKGERESVWRGEKNPNVRRKKGNSHGIFPPLVFCAWGKRATTGPGHGTAPLALWEKKGTNNWCAPSCIPVPLTCITRYSVSSYICSCKCFPPTRASGRVLTLPSRKTMLAGENHGARSASRAMLYGKC